jgi:YesN/AraC family two-component response regulator
MVNTTDSNTRILLADDEEATLSNLHGILEDEGYKVDTALNGTLALEHLGQIHCDLVVADIRMPGLSGIGLLRRIKETYPNVEVVLMTGYASVDLTIEALRLGAYDFLEKPFDMSDLLRTIGNCLDKIKLKRKNESLVDELKTHQLTLERQVKEKMEEIIVQERQLAQTEILGQALTTLAYYINNANGSIYGYAELCEPDKPKLPDRVCKLIDLCLREGRKITAVIDSLYEITDEANLNATAIVTGSDAKMLNIEAQLQRRLREMEDSG